MRTVTIPSYSYPSWRCEINGIVFEYPGGTTQSVPDEVAELIDNIVGNAPKQAPSDVGRVWKMTAAGPGWEAEKVELPIFSNGKWLKSSSTGCAWASLPAATASAAGVVKKGAAVANATSTSDVVTQLNALIASLVASGALTAST